MSRPPILDLIGGTPLIELRQVVSPDIARLLLKVEGANPTGSKKDRMALEVIEAARRDGRLRPGQAAVEYTGGSTGTSLALVCSAYRHPLFIVTSDAFSREKRDHMSALGARVELIACPDGKITENLIKGMIARSKEIAESEGAFWTDQLNNEDATNGYRGLAREILDQTGGSIDAFVDCVGTAHGIVGVADVLRAAHPDVEIVAVEPAESSFLSEGRTGGHRIEGIGLGFLPPAWKPGVADSVVTVASDDAHAMARRLAVEEGVLAGASTGANVAAALEVARRLGAGNTVVTVAVDSGIKYLSTEVYRTG
jgi:cysteine synthase A